MAIKKDRIVVGDSYHVAYRVVERSSDPRNNQKRPLTPLSASVCVYNVIDQEYLELGQNGETEVPADIRDGNVVEFVINGDEFQANGDYKVFTTAVIEVNGSIHTKTMVRPFRVLPKE